MKKLLAPALVLLVSVLSGCQKSQPVALTEVTAHLQKANTAADGPQVDELIVDSTHEAVVPINKTGQWPENNLAPVAVRFVDTGKRLGSGQQRVVFVVTIRQL